MSVLLEALKKAAEDKKKALENSEQSNKIEASLVQEDRAEKNTIPESSILEREVLESKAQSALNKPAEIKLSLNESVASAPIESIKNPEIVKTVPPPTSKEIPAAALKFDLNLDNFQKIEKKSNALNVTDKGTSNEEPKLSLKLAIEEKTEQNNSFLDKTLTEEVATLSTIQDLVESSSPLDGAVLRTVGASEEPFVDPSIDSLKGGRIEPAQTSEKLKKHEMVDLSLAKKGLDKVSAAPVVTKNTEDSLKSVALDDAYQGSPEIEKSVPSGSALMKDEFDQSEQRKELLSKDEESLVHQPTVKKSNLKVDKNALKEDEDSYKWSLDVLPGYLGLGRKKKKKRKKGSTDGENPILVAGALSEDPARSTKKSSVKLVLILLVFLLVIGILFYGVLYYQEQHDALEQRMKKYNLVKTHITVKEGASIVNKASENSIEKLETNPKPEGLHDTPLSDVVPKNVFTEDAQKESLVYTGRSEPFEKNNQTRTEAKPQRNIEKPVTSRSVTQKREATGLSLERGSYNRVTNVPKSPVQSLDKKTTSLAVDSTHYRAVVVVHSEEEILSKAYLSYGQGDFIHAQQAFETVLRMNPNNEFALIGLGNILASEQQYNAAMTFYQKALVAQPSSLNAFEAIANISGHIELNSDWKRALSDMAQDYSESATLQYALGNVYAEENDWLSAQSAYFQAVALEPDNADYLVNLAISLDQLGKYQMAARYYTEALAFVDVEAVNFNETQVKNRLISIRQFIAGRTQ